MTEQEKTLALFGVVGAVVLLGGLLIWNIASAFTHDCRPAGSSSYICVICSAPLKR